MMKNNPSNQPEPKPDAQAEVALREKVVTAIEDVFVYTLEVKLEEDVPALADSLIALFQANKAAAVVEALNQLYKDRYMITVNPQFSIFVVNANSIKDLMFRLQPPTAGEGESGEAV